MPHIHPTAIVDDRVELDDDVEVGPWCRLEGAIHVGPHCRLLERVSLRGPLRVGEGNIFYPGVCVGMEPQSRTYRPSQDEAGVVIGNQNVLREGVTIHRATKEGPTTLGNHNYLMANAHLAHDARVGDYCTLANGSGLGGHALLEDSVTLGGGAGVHQLCRVGRLAMIGGNSGVSMDLPPFCVSPVLRKVTSLNLVGLRRAQYTQHVDHLRSAFDIFFRQGHKRPRALTIIYRDLGHDPLCREFADFIRDSVRGLTAYCRS